MKPKHQRLAILIGGLCIVGSVVFITAMSLSESLVFFYTPSDFGHTYISREQRIRVGGLVVPQSLKKNQTTFSFKIKDQDATLEIRYAGILPDLFREEQAIVAEGYLESPGFFRAESVLAKHDENYKPPETCSTSDSHAR